MFSYLGVWGYCHWSCKCAMAEGPCRGDYECQEAFKCNGAGEDYMLPGMKLCERADDDTWPPLDTDAAIGIFFPFEAQFCVIVLELSTEK